MFKIGNNHIQLGELGDNFMVYAKSSVSQRSEERKNRSYLAVDCGLVAWLA